MNKLVSSFALIISSIAFAQNIPPFHLHYEENSLLRLLLDLDDVKRDYSIQDLVIEHSKNGARAETDLISYKVSINGVVGKISKNSKGVIFVNLLVGDKPLSQLFFPKNQEEYLLNLNAGDTINVICRLKEFAFGRSPILVDCTFKALYLAKIKESKLTYERILSVLNGDTQPIKLTNEEKKLIISVITMFESGIGEYCSASINLNCLKKYLNKTDALSVIKNLPPSSKVRLSDLGAYLGYSQVDKILKD